MELKPPLQLLVDVRDFDEVRLLPRARMHRLFAQLLKTDPKNEGARAGFDELNRRESAQTMEGRTEIQGGGN